MTKLLQLTAAAAIAWLLPMGSTLAQSVQVKTLSADYTNHKVTFSISWAAGTRDEKHLPKVWVFVDFVALIADHTTGAWQRADISTPTATAGTISGLTDQGFFLEGSTGTFSTTVTATLSGMPLKYNWCAHATDYPPTAVLNNGSYTLSGTPPFIINGTYTEPSFSYIGGLITSLTDNTDCPGTIIAEPEDVSDWTTCGFSYISNVSYENNADMNWSSANSYCQSKGMRLPDLTELQCMCSNKAALPGGYSTNNGGYYWSNTPANKYYYVVGFASCATSSTIPTYSRYVKCVK